jgi:eukaryotic-like serine/threonine-protein kinase
MASPVSPERVGLPARYRIVRHLRSGGMAGLWQAHDDVLDRDVAVKVLAEHLSADPAARERFEREARAVARLSSHPHVVTIYDVGECEGSAYIVMELMARGSLADRLAAEGAVPRQTALGWLGDAASALDDAHAAGIVHRDVKPANMLLDGRGGLALADFGIALVAREEQLTRTGEILGTMAYSAPEQALGRPATPASDRYSLAVVAYELLVGRRPFDAAHPAAQARAHVEDAPPPTGSAALDAVLGRGLAKDPAERWGRAGALVAALERGLGQSDVTGVTATAQPARPAAATGRTVRVRAPRAPAPVATGRTAPPRRSRTPWLAAGALALVVAGLVLAAGLGGSGGGQPSPATSQQAASAKRSAPSRSTAATTTTPPATTPATTSPPAAAAAAGDLASARRLQVAGYQARLSGQLDEALALDQRVLAACGAGRALDPCGYALFEVGAVLRRMGRGGEAAGFLQQRLSGYGDNAGGEVSRELALATGAAHGPGHANGPKKPKQKH